VVRAPLYCRRFIGRDRELYVLLRSARRAAGGECAFAFVSGDAGVGKTRLVDELCKALPRGTRDYRAACLQYAPSPMGPLLDVVSALAAQRAPPPPTGDDPVDKRRLFERVAETLRGAAAAQPLAIALDDAHWADTATLELLQFLIGTLHDAAVFVVVTYRADEVSETHPLHALIARASRARNVQRLELELLGTAQIHELIDATLPKTLRLPFEVLRDVGERSEGNPLYAEEYLKAAVDDLRSGTTGTALPASLRGLLLERLRRVAPDDMRLLEIAALIGRRFGAEFLARIGESDVTSLAPFLRRAVDEHFLVEDAVKPGWFTFRHALTRDTILSRVLAIQVRAIHAGIARAIEAEPDRDARVVELADHYWRAACFAECAVYAEQAGDLAKARHAYAEAAELYERALACGMADERGLIVLHEKAASAYASLGGPQKVLEHLDAPASYYTAAADAERLAEVHLEQALAFRRMGRTDQAFAVLRRAAELSGGSRNDRLLFKSAAQLAQLHTLAEDWPAVDAQLREGESRLTAAEPRDAVRFFIARAALHLARSELDAWERDSESANGIARAHGDPSLIAHALTSYAVGARKVGRFRAALRACGEAVEAGRPYGPIYVVAFARLVHLNVRYLLGDVMAARDELLGVLAELHEALTIRILIAQFGIALAIVLRDEALFRRCYSADVLDAAFATGEPIQFAPIAAALAEYQLAGGDTVAARALLDRMLAALPDGWDDCEVLLPVAVCCSQPAVHRARARFDAARKRQRNPFVEACAELFEAYLAARFGSREAKLRHAKAAAGHAQRLGVPLFEAEAYELAEQPTRAVAVCEAIGARRLPRRLGPKPQRREAAAHLTAREREVVDLALASLSNSAIADELSLSERTVEAHLAAAYRKLGVRSRGELLSVLARS